ncbi:MAG: hypothetical protein A3E85_02040 [Gammaproteobacteria bacterium RIFCSPHIGHO2_12_FULL_45_12]|nr:MAG: hypothetical protein A3E85_02040 [Gammaproteobacteria bacterium RIFCSPHIGHO2_12_FULL_45_12]
MTCLLEAVHEAGQAIQRLQARGFEVARKANHDLVTQADWLANDLLKAKLTQAFPAIGWLSEESVDDHARLNSERVWIVDPIDGTKEFSLGIPEYAISVALVQHEEPVLSAVYNPATNEMFHAIKGQGAWLNGVAIQCADPAESEVRLLASRSEYARGEWDGFIKQSQVEPVGSIAYKLALVAAGRAHGTFSLGPKNEWDIAAGALLVTEAGGTVTDQLHQPMKFNQKKVLVPGIVATGASWNEKIFALIRVCRQ